MTLLQNLIGVEIVKGWIAVVHLSAGKHEWISTPKQSFARFATAAEGAVVVREA